jgi:hypothetical protein
MQPRLFLSFLSFALPDKKKLTQTTWAFDGVEGIIIILSETVSPQSNHPHLFTYLSH